MSEDERSNITSQRSVGEAAAEAKHLQHLLVHDNYTLLLLLLSSWAFWEILGISPYSCDTHIYAIARSRATERVCVETNILRSAERGSAEDPRPAAGGEKHQT